MTSFWEIEQAAAKLRRQLQLARIPELKLLCLADFFKIVGQAPPDKIESYIREFLSIINECAPKSNPLEFLPNEISGVKKILDVLKIQPPGIVASEDYSSLEKMIVRLKSETFERSEVILHRRDQVCIRCIFVEYYPDLDLKPRGRILNLLISTSPISPKAESDDVNVRNPVEKPDDRFLEQARQSVKAARDYLHHKYGLSLKKRYRFDFAVDSTGARFTGDSLGVAFAVGAVAAIGKVEVFRKKISISQTVAFSGALKPDGNLAAIDSDALKLKIYRAFHSDLNLLIIPREHGVEALEYVKQLEKETPERKLDIALADDLEHVMSDPRLVPTERIPWPSFAGKKIYQARRSVWVEIPALIVLLAILFYLIAPPQWMPWFDHNPAYAEVDVGYNTLEAFNRKSQSLWSKKFDCDISESKGILIYDVNEDGKSEVLYMPVTTDKSDVRDYYYCYDLYGNQLFRNYCPIIGEHPSDTAGVFYDFAQFRILELPQDTLILTGVVQQLPARAHFKLWNTEGKMVGWYINMGHCSFSKSIDLDYDGREELLFVGFNNSYKAAVLFALKTDSTFGVSPPYESSHYDLSKIKKGNQHKYVLFPKTDLGELLLKMDYNSPWKEGLVFEDDNVIQMRIAESHDTLWTPLVFYELYYDFRLKRAVCDDVFIKRRRKFVEEGRLPVIDRGDFQAGLRDAVRHWTDSGWVTEAQLREAEASQGQ